MHIVWKRALTLVRVLNPVSGERKRKIRFMKTRPGERVCPSIFFEEEDEEFFTSKRK